MTEGETIELNLGTTVLGMFNPLPFFSKGEINKVSDFMLFCYTDGLNEAFDEQDEEFGESRIQEVLDRLHPAATELNFDMMREVNLFRGKAEYRDDVTLLTIKVTP